MLKKIRTILGMTKDVRSQSISMRRKLMLYWCTMLLTMVGLLLLLFSVFGVFSDQKEKLCESLELHANYTNGELEQHFDHLMAQCITLSEQISYEIEKTLVVKGKEARDLNNSPELLLELQNSLYEKLYTTLRVSECSGAYFVLDVTTNTKAKTVETSRSGMYLRYANLNAKNATTQDVVYFRGISDVARAEKIELHNRWNLEFDSSVFPEYDRLIHQRVSDLSRASYWTDRFQLTDTWEDVVLLVLPILDNRGEVIGLCGVEISELYFYLSYPAKESPFGTITTILAPIGGENGIELDKGMTATTDDTWLDSFEKLKIRNLDGCNLYQTEEENYLGIHGGLSVGTAEDRMIGVASLIKKQSYEDALHIHRYKLTMVFLVFFLLMFAVSVVLTNRFVKPIVNSFQAIQNEAVLDEYQSGISEIDVLMQFLKNKQFNQNIQESELPPNISELFETFLQQVESLTVSEKRIFHFYIEGYDAAEITEKAFLSMSTVRKHSGNIYRKLNISSRDELMLYVDLFRRCDRLGELYEHSKSPL